MRIRTQTKRKFSTVCRLVIAGTALVLLGACVERAYLSDDRWRKDAAVDADAPAQPAVSVAAEPGTVLEVDASLAVSDGPLSCSIPRLSAETGEVNAAELRAAYACLEALTAPAYDASGHVLVQRFSAWPRLTATPFFSDALGDRYGVVFANGRALGRESSDEHFDRGFPVGATLAVSTFTLSPDGLAEVGPLVLVEKMEPGFFALQGNWRYTMVEPDGRVAAVTRGANGEGVTICAECTHSQADLFYASLLNDGVAPFAEGDGPAFPSVDTYGASGGLVAPSPNDPSIYGGDAEGAVLDPNAPISDFSAPVILDPNDPATDG